MNDAAGGSNSLFRNYRDEIWAKLAGRLESGDGGWDGSVVRVRHGSFEVTLDQHAEVTGRASVVQTRLRAAFHNAENFRFRIRRHDWLVDIAVLFGAQDLSIGDERFDEEYVVSSSDEQKARQLLGSTELREKILEAEVDLLEVRDDEGWFGPDFPPEVDELCLCARDRVNDPDRIATLYGVFAEVLNRLCHLGAAYDDDPHLSL